MLDVRQQTTLADKLRMGTQLDFRLLKADGVDRGQGDAVERVGGLYLLHHINVMLDGVEVELGVTHTFHFIEEETVEVAVVTIHIEGILREEVSCTKKCQYKSD